MNKKIQDLQKDLRSYESFCNKQDLHLPKSGTKKKQVLTAGLFLYVASRTIQQRRNSAITMKYGSNQLSEQY